MKTKKIQKKFTIQVPNYIKILYSKENNFITFIGPKNNFKSLKLNVQVFLKIDENVLEISSIPFYKVSSYEKKHLKMKQGTTVSIIKHIITELSVSFFCQRMKFVGIGYRAFPIKTKINENQLLQLKLGYSHQIYFRFLNGITVFCFKFTKLFIFGNSYNYLTQFVSIFKSCKKPEPYKGKGILHENEKINLKIGKRV
jgi:large subunit ribosomal protein L6